MADVFSKKKRSWVMSRVKGRDTKPELLVRSIVHRMGYRFRVNRRDLPGSPDIVLPRHHKAIFVHGCFWHGHKRCRRASRPKANELFWNKKLDENIERDRSKLRALRGAGWRVLIIWECETRNPEKLASKLEKFMYE